MHRSILLHVHQRSFLGFNKGFGRRDDVDDVIRMRGEVSWIRHFRKSDS